MHAPPRVYLETYFVICWSDGRGICMSGARSGKGGLLVPVFDGNFARWAILFRIGVILIADGIFFPD